MATAQSVVTAFNSVVISLENLQRRTDGDSVLVTSVKTRYTNAGNAPVAAKLQTVIDAINVASGWITPLDEGLSAISKAVQELPDSTDDEQITATLATLLEAVGEKNPAFVATLTPAHVTVRTTVAATATQLVDRLGATVQIAATTEKALKALRKAAVAYQTALTAE